MSDSAARESFGGDSCDGFPGIRSEGYAERRLMAAVLEAAVEDCLGTGHRGALARGPTRNLRHLLQAKAYVASRDRTWLFSFENLCDALDVDPGRLRRMLDVLPATRLSPLRSRIVGDGTQVNSYNEAASDCKPFISRSR